MNVNDFTLPYPVLGIGDSILPLPKTEFDLKTEDDKYIFTFDFTIENPEIQDLIDNGKADFVCEVNCVSTFLRFCVSDKRPHFEIKINRNAVLNEISFFCSIVVNTEIKAYSNSGFHKDYSGYTFDLGPGDLLAFLGEYTYDAGLQYEKLQAIKQIMVIRRGLDGDDIKYNLATDKIEILLPPDLYDEYKNNIQYKASYANILQASLVFNSLMYALYNIEENRTTLWARSILYRLENEKELQRFDIDEQEQIPAIVNAILKSPYTKLFDCLRTLTNTEDEDN